MPIPFIVAGLAALGSAAAGTAAVVGTTAAAVGTGIAAGATSAAAIAGTTAAAAGITALGTATTLGAGVSGLIAAGGATSLFSAATAGAATTSLLSLAATKGSIPVLISSIGKLGNTLPILETVKKFGQSNNFSFLDYARDGGINPQWKWDNLLNIDTVKDIANICDMEELSDVIDDIKKLKELADNQDIEKIKHIVKDDDETMKRIQKYIDILGETEAMQHIVQDIFSNDSGSNNDITCNIPPQESEASLHIPVLLSQAIKMAEFVKALANPFDGIVSENDLKRIATAAEAFLAESRQHARNNDNTADILSEAIKMAEFIKALANPFDGKNQFSQHDLQRILRATEVFLTKTEEYRG